MALNFPSLAFNVSNTLQIITHLDIPPVALKSLLTSESYVLALEHTRDIATLCRLHQVQHEDVALKLLAASLKGKELIWF